MLCPECKTELDEIPFNYCITHQKYLNTTTWSDEEIEDYLDNEMYRILYERTGDD